MAVTRFWRLSQRWLPSATICFSLLAVSVRFSRASRRYCGDELQLRQPLVDLPLEGLQHVGGVSATTQGARTPLPGPRPPASSVRPQMKGDSLASLIFLMLPENSL